MVREKKTQLYNRRRRMARQGTIGLAAPLLSGDWSPMSHAELFEAIVTLATYRPAPAIENYRAEDAGRSIYWSTFFAGREIPCGFIVTIEGTPPVAWLVAHIGRSSHISGFSLQCVHAALGETATAIADARQVFIHPRHEAMLPGFTIIADAVRAWLASGELRGVVNP
jgi:hypothetical protein